MVLYLPSSLLAPLLKVNKRFKIKQYFNAIGIPLTNLEKVNFLFEDIFTGKNARLKKYCYPSYKPLLSLVQHCCYDGHTLLLLSRNSYQNTTVVFGCLFHLLFFSKFNTPWKTTFSFSIFHQTLSWFQLFGYFSGCRLEQFAVSNYFYFLKRFLFYEDKKPLAFCSNNMFTYLSFFDD